MANTRQSAKRARQAKRRETRNQISESATKTAVKQALDAIKAKNADQAKTAYNSAVRALGKAASKGVIPTGRASRKISRLTLLVKKTLPEILPAASGKK